VNGPDRSLSDRERLAAISAYDLFSPALRAELNALCAASAARLGQPTSVAMAVLDGAQAVLGGHGLTGTLAASDGSPVEWSFCATVARTGRPYLVEDAVMDPARADNPLVVHEGLRSYAGVPLVLPSGHVLGAHCVQGPEPHWLEPEDLNELTATAARIVALLGRHERRQA
jgi:GAF domain-containing protein